MIGQAVLGKKLVKGGQHGRVIVAAGAVDGKDAGGIADAQHLLAGELPVDIARQRGQEGNVPDVLLAVEDGLIEVGNAPPLRDVEVEALGQRRGGGQGGGVAPCAERRQLVPGLVKRQIAVHHGRNAQRAHGLQRLAVPAAVVGLQLGVGVLDPGPDIVKVVGPVAALQPVLPVMGTAGQHGTVRRGQHRLDAGGAELNAQ